MFVSSEEKERGAQKKWFAVYTKARAEKLTYSRLVEQGIISYLPIIKTLRQWSDRKKWVEKPLLSSYVFVNIDISEYQMVLNTDGVVKYITFEGKAVPIPEYQIENLRIIENSDTEVEYSELEFIEGERVEVNLGPLNGLRGELIKVGRKKRLLVRIDQIHQNLLVNIPASYLTKEV